MPHELIAPQEYQTLLGALKQRIRSAQFQALRAVNHEQIALYLDIGRMIVEKQQGETWGKTIVGSLAEDLRLEFPSANGFSAANLWRMRNFYEAYGQNEKLAQLCEKLGGRTTSRSWRSAKTQWSESSTSAVAGNTAGPEMSWSTKSKAKPFSDDRQPD